MDQGDGHKAQRGGEAQFTSGLSLRDPAFRASSQRRERRFSGLCRGSPEDVLVAGPLPCEQAADGSRGHWPDPAVGYKLPPIYHISFAVPRRRLAPPSTMGPPRSCMGRLLQRAGLQR